MPRFTDVDDDWEDEAWRDPHSLDEDDDEPIVPCPYCQKEMLEDMIRCPSCGQYISREDAPPGPRPLWIVVGIILCLLVVLLWIF